jgi:hypothetical protein
MRRCTEDRLELPDEMKGRNPNVARELADRERPLKPVVEQEVASAT